MTSKKWWEETRELMNHINANPVITATYPCLEPVVGYLRDLCFDLGSAEARIKEELSFSKAIAEARDQWKDECEAHERDVKISEERSFVLAKEVLDKTEALEQLRERLYKMADKADKAEEELDACNRDRIKLEQYWEKRQGE